MKPKSTGILARWAKTMSGDWPPIVAEHARLRGWRLATEDGPLLGRQCDDDVSKSSGNPLKFVLIREISWPSFFGG